MVVSYIFIFVFFMMFICLFKQSRSAWHTVPPGSHRNVVHDAAM